MNKRPILSTLLFWGVVGLVQLYLSISCGFGAGWDLESSAAITDCRYEAQVWIGWVNVLAIAAYALWAVITIRRLSNKDGE